MKKRTYLSAGLALLIGTLSVHASPGFGCQEPCITGGL